MLHLDPARTNRSPFAGLARPSIAWTFNAGAPIEAAPAVLADRTIVLSTLGGKLFGITPQGAKAFVVDLKGRAYASPLVTDTGIYAGSDDAHFFGLQHDGGLRWTLGVDGDADTAATPTPYGAIVFAAGRVVYATRSDGSVLWRVKAKRKVHSSPAVGQDGTVYVGGQDDRLTAIARDGKIKWSVMLDGDVDCAPTIEDDGTVYVGTDGGTVQAIDGSEGTVRWRTKVGGVVRGSLTATRSHAVIAGVYGPAPRVVSLDARTGEELWSFAIQGTGAREFGVHGSPVEDRDGNLYFGAQDDVVYALAPNGLLRWKLATGGDVDAPLVLMEDGVLLVASDDGTLRCVKEEAQSSGGGT